MSNNVNIDPAQQPEVEVGKKSEAEQKAEDAAREDSRRSFARTQAQQNLRTAQAEAFAAPQDEAKKKALADAQAAVAEADKAVQEANTAAAAAAAAETAKVAGEAPKSVQQPSQESRRVPRPASQDSNR